jgi:hypothetical protein
MYVHARMQLFQNSATQFVCDEYSSDCVQTVTRGTQRSHDCMPGSTHTNAHTTTVRAAIKIPTDSSLTNVQLDEV